MVTSELAKNSSSANNHQDGQIINFISSINCTLSIIGLALLSTTYNLNVNADTSVTPSIDLSQMSVISGQATHSQSGNNFTINVSTQQATLNWGKFDVGENQYLNFQQLQNGIVLNRVTGDQVSQILGNISSNGKVYLINPNGIIFGSNSSIDVQSLVASTLDLSATELVSSNTQNTNTVLDGNLQFTQANNNTRNNTNASVINKGTIKVSNEGQAYLIGQTVQNEGTIQALNGDVYLLAGKQVSITDNQVTYTVSAGSKAINLGKIYAGKQTAMLADLVQQQGEINVNRAKVGNNGVIELVSDNSAFDHNNTNANTANSNTNDSVSLDSATDNATLDGATLIGNKVLVDGAIRTGAKSHVSISATNKLQITDKGAKGLDTLNNKVSISANRIHLYADKQENNNYLTANDVNLSKTDNQSGTTSNVSYSNVDSQLKEMASSQQKTANTSYLSNATLNYILANNSLNIKATSISGQNISVSSQDKSLELNALKTINLTDSTFDLKPSLTTDGSTNVALQETQSQYPTLAIRALDQLVLDNTNLSSQNTKLYSSKSLVANNLTITGNNQLYVVDYEKLNDNQKNAIFGTNGSNELSDITIGQQVFYTGANAQTSQYTMSDKDFTSSDGQDASKYSSEDTIELGLNLTNTTFASNSSNSSIFADKASKLSNTTFIGTKGQTYNITLVDATIKDKLSVKDANVNITTNSLNKSALTIDSFVDFSTDNATLNIFAKGINDKLAMDLILNADSDLNPSSNHNSNPATINFKGAGITLHTSADKSASEIANLTNANLNFSDANVTWNLNINSEEEVSNPSKVHLGTVKLENSNLEFWNTDTNGNRVLSGQHIGTYAGLQLVGMELTNNSTLKAAIKDQMLVGKTAHQNDSKTDFSKLSATIVIDSSSKAELHSNTAIALSYLDDINNQGSLNLSNYYQNSNVTVNIDNVTVANQAGTININTHNHNYSHLRLNISNSSLKGANLDASVKDLVNLTISNSNFDDSSIKVSSGYQNGDEGVLNAKFANSSLVASNLELNTLNQLNIEKLELKDTVITPTAIAPPTSTVVGVNHDLLLTNSNVSFTTGHLAFDSQDYSGQVNYKQLRDNGVIKVANFSISQKENSQKEVSDNSWLLLAGKQVEFVEGSTQSLDLDSTLITAQDIKLNSTINIASLGTTNSHPFVTMGIVSSAANDAGIYFHGHNIELNGQILQTSGNTDLHATSSLILNSGSVLNTSGRLYLGDYRSSHSQEQEGVTPQNTNTIKGWDYYQQYTIESRGTIKANQLLARNDMAISTGSVSADELFEQNNLTISNQAQVNAHRLAANKLTLDNANLQVSDSLFAQFVNINNQSNSSIENAYIGADFSVNNSSLSSNGELKAVNFIITNKSTINKLNSIEARNNITLTENSSLLTNNLQAQNVSVTNANLVVNGKASVTKQIELTNSSVTLNDSINEQFIAHNTSITGNSINTNIAIMSNNSNINLQNLQAKQQLTVANSSVKVTNLNTGNTSINNSYLASTTVNSDKFIAKEANLNATNLNSKEIVLINSSLDAQTVTSPIAQLDKSNIKAHSLNFNKSITIANGSTVNAQELNATNFIAKQKSLVNVKSNLTAVNLEAHNNTIVKANAISVANLTVTTKAKVESNSTTVSANTILDEQAVLLIAKQGQLNNLSSNSKAKLALAGNITITNLRAQNESLVHGVQANVTITGKTELNDASMEIADLHLTDLNTDNSVLKAKQLTVKGTTSLDNNSLVQAINATFTSKDANLTLINSSLRVASNIGIASKDFLLDNSTIVANNAYIVSANTSLIGEQSSITANNLNLTTEVLEVDDINNIIAQHMNAKCSWSTSVDCDSFGKNGLSPEKANLIADISAKLLNDLFSQGALNSGSMTESFAKSGNDGEEGDKENQEDSKSTNSKDTKDSKNENKSDTNSSTADKDSAVNNITLGAVAKNAPTPKSVTRTNLPKLSEKAWNTIQNTIKKVQQIIDPSKQDGIGNGVEVITKSLTGNESLNPFGVVNGDANVEFNGIYSGALPYGRSDKTFNSVKKTNIGEIFNSLDGAIQPGTLISRSRQSELYLNINPLVINNQETSSNNSTSEVFVTKDNLVHIIKLTLNKSTPDEIDLVKRAQKTNNKSK